MSDPRKPPEMLKVSTRPEDWIPATRIYLFGKESLSAEEWARERTRMSGGRRKWRE